MKKTVQTIEFTWEEKTTCVNEKRETTVRQAGVDEPVEPDIDREHNDVSPPEGEHV